ncbi:hypothetical protein PAXRUDRAFT_224262 [Paxillus rubicundulus Ve08.2h10]|uniref:Uncharacterized protein n=1 Tax=Paxillus rubicundulus Ve08.2h10 TaxID=930991 RepID=A0A0D0E171_9AGAM|nr:hypothetical protein PAXRUDRAFT_224262 [Paxillus rubicundulus Ve08.2h10]
MRYITFVLGKHVPRMLTFCTPASIGLIFIFIWHQILNTLQWGFADGVVSVPNRPRSMCGSPTTAGEPMRSSRFPRYQITTIKGGCG